MQPAASGGSAPYPAYPDRDAAPDVLGQTARRRDSESETARGATVALRPR